MKIRFVYALLVALAAITILANCSGKKDEHAESHEQHEHASETSDIREAGAPQFEVDVKFQKQLGNVFTTYVNLKDALVASDAAKVKAKASEILQALAEVDMKLVTGAAHHDWMTYLEPMETSAKEIEATTDLESQRKSFSSLSDNLYKSVKAFGLGGQEAFYEFCPMAFNNQGGYWLSDKNEVRNPYFGDKMLTCGVVQEKLK